MKYIYDILVNFKREIYDFYDWNKEDKIINIRKIPVIKVKKEVLYDLIYKKVEISDEFLKSIYNKTDAFHQVRFQVLPYASVFTDGNMVCAIKFHYKRNEFVSLLLFDEEEEVLDIAKKMDITDISYKIIGEKNFSLKTRREMKKITYIQNELKNITVDELKYLYFDCFNKKNINENEMRLEINNHLNERSFLDYVYDFFSLTSKKTN